MRLLRYLPRFRAAYRSLDEMALRERWPRRDIETFQLERLNAVWRHAVAHVPYYRQLRTKHRLPARFESLVEFQSLVPLLHKSELRANPKSFLSESRSPGRWMRTGGSTGAPLTTFWGSQAHLENLRTRYRYYAAWGIDVFDRTGFLWGHSGSFAPGMSGYISRMRQPMEDWLRNRMRLSAYHADPETLRSYLRRSAAFQPVTLYGYSRSLYLLAREAEATGFFCDTLKLCTLTGESAFPHMVETIERVLGAPATTEYGTIECGLIATEGPDRQLRVREDFTFVETVPRPDGRQDIVLSVLANPSFPLLRYAIDDVTDAPLSIPDHGFAILKNVAGRNFDFIRSKGGRCLHPARLDALFKYHHKAIRRFQVRQHADGALAVAIEVEGAAAVLDVSRLEVKLRDLVEGYPVKVEVVDTIPQTPAGKNRSVICDMADLDTAPSEPATAADGTTSSRVAANGGASRNASTRPAATAAEANPSVLVGKAARLRGLIERPEMAFLMEAHNGLSSRIAEQAGFEAIWASGLSISAALGVRDSNEASWTQVLEILEFMSDATRIPILVDGDTGHGNFNNMRRLVHKLEQRAIAGVCIEDKLFPKTNSFLRGTAQPLADIDEFCGRVKAGKDAQHDDAFVVIARCEAFIAGWGLAEAMKRCESYRKAGADAILIHSALRSPKEVLAFKREWGDRLPVVIVPTKYYATPTEVFREHNFAAVIWANHLMRSCITAMQATARTIYERQSLLDVEERVAPLSEVFRLQEAHELEEAEKRDLPRNAGNTRGIILAASRGTELGELTETRPKCMVPVAGAPILAHILRSYRSVGITDLAVVRGYQRAAVDLEDVRYFENEEATATRGVYSLYNALPALEGNCIISYGDVLFKKYVLQELLELEADFAIAVDANWAESRNRGRYADYVTCSRESSRRSIGPVRLRRVGPDLAPAETHGEWMGFLKLSQDGAHFVYEYLTGRVADPATLKAMEMGELLQAILAAGKAVSVIYTTGSWLDIDSVEDVLAAGEFQSDLTATTPRLGDPSPVSGGA